MDGIFMMLLVAKSNKDFFKFEYKTIGTVFENIYLFNYHLTVLVASDTDIKFSDEMMKSYFKCQPDEKDIVYRDNYVPINYFR